MLKPLALTVLLSVGAFAAHAQSAIHYRQNDKIDPREVARVLSAAQGPVLTRSIRLLAEGGPVAATQPATPSALSVPVQFAFDSAAILPTASAQLDVIAAGIKLLPSTQNVVVEGHTDAAGGETYNLGLSHRRAATVKAYLVEMHGIDAQRILDRGLGKQRPIDGLDPFAPENRRVQFRGG